MSLNPHPIVLTTASDRHRAELLALAAPAQRRYPALSRARLRLHWRMRGGTWVVSEILGLRVVTDGKEPSRRAAMAIG